MDTLSDIDPQLVEAVLAHADDFLEAQRRIEKILSAAEQKVTKAERDLAAQLKAGVSEETAVDEYSTTSHGIRTEIELFLQELTKEYEVKFRIAKETD